MEILGIPPGREVGEAYKLPARAAPRPRPDVRGRRRGRPAGVVGARVGDPVEMRELAVRGSAGSARRSGCSTRPGGPASSSRLSVAAGPSTQRLGQEGGALGGLGHPRWITGVVGAGRGATTSTISRPTRRKRRPALEVALVLVRGRDGRRRRTRRRRRAPGRGGPGCRRTDRRRSSTCSVDQRVGPSRRRAPRSAGSRPRAGPACSLRRQRRGRRRRTSRYQRRVAAVAAHPADRGQLGRRRPCRRRPPSSADVGRAAASRRRVRARRSRTGCRGPARPRRRDPVVGDARRRAAVRCRSPLAAIGTGSRVTPSLRQAVEEAAAEQPQRRPAGDDRVRSGAGVRLQDPLLDQLVADRRRARTAPARCAASPVRGPAPGSDRSSPVGSTRTGTTSPVTGGAIRLQRMRHAPGSARTGCGPNQRLPAPVDERVEMTRKWLPGSGPGQPLFRRLDGETGRRDHSSPRMKASTRARPSSSGSCTGGDFMRYDDAEMIGPPMPRSLAIFAARIASMMMPAELGESQTSSLYSRLSGTSPNARPSRRT